MLSLSLRISSKRPLSTPCSGTGESATCGLWQRSKVKRRTWQPQWLPQMQDRCSGSRSWANVAGLTTPHSGRRLLPSRWRLAP